MRAPRFVFLAALALTPGCGCDPQGFWDDEGPRLDAGTGGGGDAGTGGGGSDDDAGPGGGGDAGTGGGGSDDDAGTGGGDDAGTGGGGGGDAGTGGGGDDAGTDGGGDAGAGGGGDDAGTGGGGDDAGAPLPPRIDAHVHIAVANDCTMTVDPPSFTIDAGRTLLVDWHNHSADFPVEVWMSYGGGFTDLMPGATWDEPIEHCTNVNPYVAYADISTACSSVRVPITCR